jgi:Domain of unknown function (DUF4328)
MGQIRRIGGIAKAAMALTALAGALGLVSSLILTSVNSKAIDFLDGRIDASEFDDAYQPVQLLQTLQSVIGFAAGVVTIIWMFKIANNVRAFGRQTTWAPLFAIFGWILPPVLVVIPFLMLRELWKASDSRALPDTESWKSSGDNPLLYVWFVLYALIPFVITALTIGAVIDTALNANGSSEVTAEALAASDQYTIISAVVTLAAAVVWVVIVKRLTARHVALTGER